MNLENAVYEQETTMTTEGKEFRSLPIFTQVVTARE